MTRKADYVTIAKIIADHRGRGLSDTALDELAKDFCEYFERDNPAFDTVRFLRASRRDH